MGNENLRAALQHAGLQPDDLAQIIEVDVKTVRRWLSGMAPYPRHRGRVARALDTAEHQLWPELATRRPPSRQPNAANDLLAAYPTTNDPAAPDWQPLMRDATERIDLLDETLIHILAADGVPDLLDETLIHILAADGVPDLLADKGAQGCEIRILIAETDSLWVRLGEGTRRRTDPDSEDDEQDDHRQREVDANTQAWQDANQRARDLLGPLCGQPRIAIHSYLASRFNTILRVDDQMLVTVHLWAQSTPQAPLLHLQRKSPDGLFDRFAEHYDALWQDASLPLEARSDTDHEKERREPSGHHEPPAAHEHDIDRPRQAATQPPSEPSNPDRPRRWPRRPPSDFTGR